MKIDHPLVIEEKDTTKPPGFTPPEVIEGGNYEQKGDVWALGCLFYLSVS